MADETEEDAILDAATEETCSADTENETEASDAGTETEETVSDGTEDSEAPEQKAEAIPDLACTPQHKEVAPQHSSRNPGQKNTD